MFVNYVDKEEEQKSLVLIFNKLVPFWVLLFHVFLNHTLD